MNLFFNSLASSCSSSSLVVVLLFDLGWAIAVSLPSFASSRRCSNSAILFVNLSSIVLWPCSSLFSIYCMSSGSSVVGGLPLLVFAGVSFVSWVCVFLLISFISCYRFLIASSFVSSLASINVSYFITCSIYVYCYVYFRLVGCF